MDHPAARSVRAIMASVRHPDSRGIQVVLGCCVAALILLRDTGLLIDPRFFCEEGSVFFSYAWSHSALDTLRFAPLGYYAMAHNVCALAAARAVPLESAPLLTSLAGGLFQLLPFAIVLTGRAPMWSRPWRKVLGCAVMLSARISDEVWLTSLCVHFHLALAAALLLIEPAAGVGRRRGLLAAVILVFGGLTTPLTCFLVPFFALKAHREKTGWSRAWCASVVVATVVQGAVVVGHLGAAASRFELLSPPDLAAVLLVKCFVVPIAGLRAGHVLTFDYLLPARQAGDLPYPMIIIGLGVLSLVLFAACRRNLPKDQLLFLFGPAALLALVGISGAAMGQERWALVEPLRHTRYFFVTNVLVLLALVAATGREGQSAWANRLAAVALAVAVTSGFWDYRSLRSTNPSWPSWRQECAAWRTHRTEAPRAHPPDVSVHLTRERNLDWF